MNRPYFSHVRHYGENENKGYIKRYWGMKAKYYFCFIKCSDFCPQIIVLQ